MRTVFDYESAEPFVSISARREEYGVAMYQDKDSVFVFYEDDEADTAIR